MENWVEGRISSIKFYENLNEIVFEFEDEYNDSRGTLSIRDPYNTKSDNKMKTLLLDSLGLV